MGVGPHEEHLLKLFGMEVRQAFGHTAYHVGSSLTQKSGWRDVDVRLLLPADEFARYFPPEGPPRLHIWNLAWTMLGRKMTGLPIDFQFDDLDAANEVFDGPRSALIFVNGDDYRTSAHVAGMAEKQP